MGVTHKNAERGFTLIEVLIALVLLVVGLAAMIPSLVHTIRGNVFARDTTLAATFAQAKLEELRRLPFSDTSSTNDLVDMCGSVQAETATDPAFTIKWWVQDADGSGSCSTDVFTIETCAAANAVVDTLCFPSSGTPQIARYFLAVRTNLDP